MVYICATCTTCLKPHTLCPVPLITCVHVCFPSAQCNSSACDFLPLFLFWLKFSACCVSQSCQVLSQTLNRQTSKSNLDSSPPSAAVLVGPKDSVQLVYSPVHYVLATSDACSVQVVASSLDTLEPVVLEGFESKEDLVACLKASANVPRIAGEPLQHRYHHPRVCPCSVSQSMSDFCSGLRVPGTAASAALEP